MENYPQNQPIPPLTNSSQTSTQELIPTKTAAAEVVSWLSQAKTLTVINSFGSLVVLILGKFNNVAGLGSCALLCGVNIFALNKVRAEIQRLKTKYTI